MSKDNVLDDLQEKQGWVFHLRDKFDDHSVQWAALHLLWQAHRCAWYALHGDNDGTRDKLDLVQDAMRDLYAYLRQAKEQRK
jgi:hypothetical protein